MGRWNCIRTVLFHFFSDQVQRVVMGSYSLCLRALSCELTKGSLMLLQLFHIYIKSLEICVTIWENYYTRYFVRFPTDSETMVTGLNQY